jgi:hypothetical protein
MWGAIGANQNDSASNAAMATVVPMLTVMLELIALGTLVGYTGTSRVYRPQ